MFSTLTSVKPQVFERGSFDRLRMTDSFTSTLTLVKPQVLSGGSFADTSALDDNSLYSFSKNFLWDRDVASMLAGGVVSAHHLLHGFTDICIIHIGCFEEWLKIKQELV